MASSHDLVARVRRRGALDGRQHAGARFAPGVVEAGDCCAAVADVGVDGAEHGVGDDVADGGGAAEGDDDERVCAVGRNVACHVCDEGAAEMWSAVWTIHNASMDVLCNASRESTYFSNSITVVVLAACTRGQLPTTQVSFVPGLLPFVGQYAAAAYCSKSWRLEKTSSVTAGGDELEMSIFG